MGLLFSWYNIAWNSYMANTWTRAFKPLVLVAGIIRIWFCYGGLVVLNENDKVMKKIYYPNCSELLADFNIHDPEVFLSLIKDLGKRYQWQFDPPLSLQFLKDMIADMKRDDRDDRLTSTVIDTKGRMTKLNYGDNGYDPSLGFWFADSGNNDHDETQYPFFAAAIQECQAEMKTYDGGHSEGFDEWTERNQLPLLAKKAICGKKLKSKKE